MTGPRATPGTTGVPVRTTGPVVEGRAAVPVEVVDMGGLEIRRAPHRSHGGSRGSIVRCGDQRHERVLTCQRNGRKTTQAESQTHTIGHHRWCASHERRRVVQVYAEERQHAIASLVAERGRLAVTAVAEQFGVTSETVRRDLALLERAGMLRRVHGGAVPAGSLTLA